MLESQDKEVLSQETNSEMIVATQRLGKLLLPHQQLIVCTITQPFNCVSPIQFAKDCFKGMAD
jgi:hypothetical protein